MKTKKVLILSGSILLLCVLLCGCIRITFTNLAKSSGYETLLDSTQQKRVVWINESDTLPNLPNDGNMYAIAAKHLLPIINQYPKCIVYLWKPQCEVFPPISLMQQMCDEKGAELLVVSSSFASAFEQNMDIRDHPLFIANEHIYQEKRFEDASLRFERELVGLSDDNKFPDSLWARMYVFKNGKFVGVDDWKQKKD